MTGRYVTYDPNNGLDFYETREEARAALDDAIDEYRKEAQDYGWHEDVEGCWWGLIVEEATQFDCVVDEDHEGEVPVDYSPAMVPGWSQAALDVLYERSRQLGAEGYSPEHDDQHVYGELAMAASCYAVPTRYRSHPGPNRAMWPWSADAWKPGPTRRGELVKAAALLLAEIERMDRAIERTSSKGQG